MLPKHSLLSLITSLAGAVLLLNYEQNLSARSPLGSLSAPRLHNRLDSSSLDFGGLTLLSTSSFMGDDDCFDASKDPRLIPAQTSDCLHAAQQVLEKGSLTRPIFLAVYEPEASSRYYKSSGLGPTWSLWTYFMIQTKTNSLFGWHIRRLWIFP